MRLDQLARYLNLGLEQVDGLVHELEETPLLLSKTFFENEHRWLWLNRRAAALAGTGLSHRCYPPDLLSLRHRYAVNGVRLHLEELYAALIDRLAKRIEDALRATEGDR